jgi:hypothetical protein
MVLFRDVLMGMNFKAQSAMEYLMTYGWAILIIAVVLGALFGLGVFSNPIGSTVCVAGSGFYCSALTYSHASGTVTATIGQSTATNWGNVLLLFAIQGNTISSNGPTVPTTQQSAVGSMTSGQSVTATFISAGGSSAVVGSTIAGTIWACYIVGNAAVLTDSAGTCSAAPAGQLVYYTQIAKVSAKAT